jgi:hypothetical protein
MIHLICQAFSPATLHALGTSEQDEMKYEALGRVPKGTSSGAQSVHRVHSLILLRGSLI